MVSGFFSSFTGADAGSLSTATSIADRKVRQQSSSMKISTSLHEMAKQRAL
jgi:hypothetical protein